MSCVVGEVHLNRPLDYENLLSRTKTITVYVDAISTTGQASSATLQVNIININDNSPEFDLNVSSRYANVNGSGTLYQIVLKQLFKGRFPRLYCIIQLTVCFKMCMQNFRVSFPIELRLQPNSK